jgi:hypothetical protein
MKYLALVYYQEEKIKAMTDKQWQDLNQECIRCVEKLTEQGHFLGGQPLEMTDTATTLRVRDGEVLISDGPFAETKEQLAGFYMLEAKDLDQALQLASGIPPARLGSIEVRPARELPPKQE